MIVPGNPTWKSWGFLSISGEVFVGRPELFSAQPTLDHTGFVEAFQPDPADLINRAGQSKPGISITSSYFIYYFFSKYIHKCMYNMFALVRAELRTFYHLA